MIGVILMVLGLVESKWMGKLRFNHDGEFKILQFTDLHFGEDDVLDFSSKQMMSQMIDRIKPDLVVLSGDMFSGHSEKCHGDEAIPNCYKRGWTQYTSPMVALRQPYAIILGNHDAQADLNRKEIMELDMTNDFSLTDVDHSSTDYHLRIYDIKGDVVLALIWMFDSQDSGCSGYRFSWGCVEPDQIEWFNKEYKAITEELQVDQIQSVAFVHIPVPEFVELFNHRATAGNIREKISCPCLNTGLTDAMIQNHVQASFSGHDHGNDYIGTYIKDEKSIELGYGRKSGFGGYPPPEDIKIGARVIDLKSNGDVTTIINMKEESQVFNVH